MLEKLFFGVSEIIRLKDFGKYLEKNSQHSLFSINFSGKSRKPKQFFQGEFAKFYRKCFFEINLDNYFKNRRKRKLPFSMKCLYNITLT